MKLSIPLGRGKRLEGIISSRCICWEVMNAEQYEKRKVLVGNMNRAMGSFESNKIKRDTQEDQ